MLIDFVRIAGLCGGDSDRCLTPTLRATTARALAPCVPVPARGGNATFLDLPFPSYSTLATLSRACGVQPRGEASSRNGQEVEKKETTSSILHLCSQVEVLNRSEAPRMTRYDDEDRGRDDDGIMYECDFL